LTLRWQQQQAMAFTGLLPPSDPAAAAADAAVARRQYLASLYAQYCAAQQLQHSQQEGVAALGAYGSGSWPLQEEAAAPYAAGAEVEGEGADVAIAEVDISEFDMDIDCEFNKLLEEPVMRLTARPAAEWGAQRWCWQWVWWISIHSLGGVRLLPLPSSLSMHLCLPLPGTLPFPVLPAPPACSP
jgi:hypothetical protein